MKQVIEFLDMVNGYATFGIDGSRFNAKVLTKASEKYVRNVLTDMGYDNKAVNNDKETFIVHLIGMNGRDNPVQTTFHVAV